jgi:hypothetical protein
VLCGSYARTRCEQGTAARHMTSHGVGLVPRWGGTPATSRQRIDCGVSGTGTHTMLEVLVEVSTRVCIESGAVHLLNVSALPCHCLRQCSETRSCKLHSWQPAQCRHDIKRVMCCRGLKASTQQPPPTPQQWSIMLLNDMVPPKKGLSHKCA